MITREGEKILTMNNAQPLKQQMNAEKAALKRAREGSNVADSAAGDEPHFQAMNAAAIDFENEVAGGQLVNDGEVGTYKYEERPDLEVENLNSWERNNLGDDESDSDEEGHH